MLENIFLLSLDGKTKNKTKATKDPLPDSTLLTENPPLLINTFLAYPNEQLLFQDSSIFDQILSSQNSILHHDINLSAFNEEFMYANSKAILIEGLNFLLLVLPHSHILGLVFDIDTNPYDYRNELIRLLQESIFQKFIEKLKTNNQTNLLLTLFIDLRRFEDESSVFRDQLSNNQLMVIDKKPLIKVFVFGLDNAGKTSLMRLLATKKFDYDYFPPTKKFRIINIQLDSGVKLVMWDMPGQKIFRQEWIRGAQASNLIIFMLDVADNHRFQEAKEEFWNMVNLYELHEIPILFLINKIDLICWNESVDQDIKKFFDLNRLDSQKVIIVPTSLPNRLGMEEMMQFMLVQARILLDANGIKLKL
jgi:ADP-ribosylation factor-like protein 3